MPTIRQLEGERGEVGRTVRFGPYAGAQVLSVRVLLVLMERRRMKDK